MIVADVMTRNVISIAPGATVEDAAKAMLDRGVSGLFVVDAQGELVGVVTEGDLLRRDELGTQRHRPWWLRLLVSPGRQAADFTHTYGRHVSDVMTRDVIAVGPEAPLEQVVDTMERHAIKRVPVVENQRVTGVVSRSDLLRALIGQVRKTPIAGDDRAIRSAILDALEKQPWAPVISLNVTVADGVADVWGTITDDAERRAICVCIENTPGVKTIHDHMVYVEPYSGTVIEAPDEQK